MNPLTLCSLNTVIYVLVHYCISACGLSRILTITSSQMSDAQDPQSEEEIFEAVNAHSSITKVESMCINCEENGTTRYSASLTEPSALTMS